MSNIEVNNLSFSYFGSRVLNRFSAKIKKGSATFIFGPSGCGKTTLLRLILALIKPMGGGISGLEKETAAAVFQEDRLLGYLGAVDNVLFVDGTLSESDVAKQLKETGIAASDLKKPVSEFSGGMKRRVSIVRAVAANRSLIVMDEPFKGLDDDTKLKVVEYIKKRSAGKTLIIVSHDEADAALFSADIIRLEKITKK